MQMPRPVPRRERSVPRPGPRVLYFTRTDLPSRKANSIQSFNTCWELARQGADVVLVVQQLTQSRREIFDFYGLPDEPRLRLASLSLPIEGDFNDWKGKTFRNWLRPFLTKWATPGSIIFTRDPAGLELLRTFESLDFEVPVKTVFEVHKVSFLVKASHQEERGRSLDHPKVAARIEDRRMLEAEIYENADGIICTSDNARRLLDEHFAAHAPTTVIANGTRIPQGSDGSLQTPEPLDDSGRDLDVVYVGQLYAWKGVDQLVRAMKQLPGRRLDIVGGNMKKDLDRIHDLVASEGLSDRVTLHGYVPPPAVRGFLARTRVGVIPLPSRGFVEATLFTSPLKLFELWQQGVPVVASDVPSIRELVPQGAEALLVGPDDITALADGLRTVLEDRELASRMVRAGGDLVQTYSWETRASRILDFLRDLPSTRLGNEV